MSAPDPQLAAQAASREGQDLWARAPAWRNLTFVAAGLTVTAAALALPPLLAPQPSAPAPVAATQPPSPPPSAGGGADAPGLGGAGRPPASAPVVAAQAPAPERRAPAPPPPLAPVRAPAAPVTPRLASATAPAAVAAPQSAPAAQASTCMLALPPAPAGFDLGRVDGFEDHAASLARLQVNQRTFGGLIDPAYLDNPRVIVRGRDGRGHIVVLPKGMAVQLGDRVSIQGIYRNMNLPCNYVPPLVTADLGPPPAAGGAGGQPQDSAPARPPAAATPP